MILQLLYRGRARSLPSSTLAWALRVSFLTLDGAERGCPCLCCCSRDTSSGCVGNVEVNDAAGLKIAGLRLLKGTLSSFLSF